KRPRFGELFAPALIRTTVVATVLSACAYAAAFGTLQVTVAQGVPGLPDLAPVRAQMTPLVQANQALQKELAALPKGTPEYNAKDQQYKDNLKVIGKLNREQIQPVREHVQFLQELGGLLGRVLLAIALLYVASKRLLLWLFQVPGLVIIPVVWFWVF